MSRPAQTQAPERPLAMNETLTIARLGQRGDGVCDSADGQVFVPYTLPGETVRAVRDGERGQLVEIIAPSDSRIAAICPLFTRCGGCAAQHMERRPLPRLEAQPGRGRAAARRHRGTEVGEIVDAHGAGRRRVTFHARREGTRHDGRLHGGAHA